MTPKELLALWDLAVRLEKIGLPGLTEILLLEKYGLSDPFMVAYGF